MSNQQAPYKNDSARHASGSSSKPQRGGYRTVLCRNLLTTGSCRYGDRCTFAHSDVPPPAGTATELDPFNPTNDDPVSPVYPIRRQLRKPSWEGGPPADRPRGRSFGYEPPFEGLFALTGVPAPAPPAHSERVQEGDKDESKRAKNPHYRTKPCKLYAQGVCTHGEACSFLHTDEHTPSISIRSQSASPSINSANRAASSSATPNRLLYKTSPCRFYSSVPGAPSCTKGEHCTFLHGEERASWRDRAVKKDKNVRSPSDGVPTGEDSADEKHRLWRTEPCVYYQQGKCSRGDNCNYLHVAAQDNQASLGRKPCKIFAENGFCKWGTECRYVHQTPDNGFNPDLTRSSSHGPGPSSHESSARPLKPVAQPRPTAEVDSEDEDDFEVVLDQGSTGEPSPLLYGGQPMQHQQQAAKSAGGPEAAEEEEIDANDVHLAFKHLSVSS